MAGSTQTQCQRPNPEVEKLRLLYTDGVRIQWAGDFEEVSSDMVNLLKLSSDSHVPLLLHPLLALFIISNRASCGGICPR